jgi:peptidoglycan/LPS O-acetylase OafA/YrhL
MEIRSNPSLCAGRDAPNAPPDGPEAQSFLASLPGRLQRRLSGGAYRPEIDGLRFLAIAIVVLGHFTERALRFFPHLAEHGDSGFVRLLTRPGLGVYLFFAVSGFILATQALKSKDGPLSARFLRSYFSRRLLRIEPPYLILLFVTWAALTLSSYHPENTNHFAAKPDSLGLSLLGSVFYLHDLIWGAFPRLFPPGWSLEIEVQFYLIAPLLFFAYFNLSGWSRQLCGWALLALGVIASLYTPHTLGGFWVFDSILRFFHFFWLGILLTDWRAPISAAMGRMPAPMAGALGFLALAVFLIVPDATDNPANAWDLGHALALRALTLITTATMFACVFAPNSGFRAFCAHPWISLIGGACYSIYLTHLQTIQLATSLIAKRASDSPLALIPVIAGLEVLVVVVVGLAYYALIERTFMIKDWHLRLWRRGAARKDLQNAVEAAGG